MLAHALSLLWLTLALMLCAVVGFWGPQHPVLATWIVMLSLFGSAGVLAVEFALMYVLAGGSEPRQTPAAPPSPRLYQVLQAWWGESIASLLVFGWWQPFRAHAQPDYLPEHPTGQRGVVLVHGFVCNRALWMPWFGLLRERGHAFVAVNLEPVFGSIDGYVPVIDHAVRRVTQATGMPPVLVCHSMGGLAARAWLRAARKDGGESSEQRIRQVITLGTPHHGTWLARLNLLPFSVNAHQMQLNSPWLQALQNDESRCAPTSPSDHGIWERFVCFYSHCDNIVFPAETATLPGADNRHLPGIAHVAMALNQRVIHDSLALIGKA